MLRVRVTFHLIIPNLIHSYASYTFFPSLSYLHTYEHLMLHASTSFHKA